LVSVVSAGVSTAASVEASTGAATARVSSAAMGSDFSAYHQLVPLKAKVIAYLGGLDLLLLGRLFLGTKELGKEAFTLSLGLFDLVLWVSECRLRVTRMIRKSDEEEGRIEEEKEVMSRKEG
jgi:hypothetical protein